MINSFNLNEASFTHTELPSSDKTAYRRLPSIVLETGEMPGGAALEDALDLAVYDAVAAPSTDTSDPLAAESVPLTVYRALHPLLRLLQVIGYVPLEVRVNPPAPNGVATLNRGTRPVTIDLTHMEAIPFDVSEPDFVDRPFGKLDLPGAAPSPNWDVFGGGIVFHHQQQLSHAGRLLRDMELIAQVDPNSTLRFGSHWDDKFGYLGINLSNHSQSSFDQFATALQEQVETLINTYLDEFENHAQANVDSIQQIDADTVTVLRPTGPSGLMVDPMQWSHLFRYGETTGKRRARINVADEIGKVVWDYYGSTPARARELLQSEAFGDLITPAVNPEIPDAQTTEPYYELVSLEQRMYRAIEGKTLADGGTPNDRAIRSKVKSLIRKWASIVESDIQNMTGTFSGYHDYPAAPSASQYQAAPLTGFVMDAINRHMIGYRGQPHIGTFDLGGAGFGLRSKVLQPVEGLMGEVIRSWGLHRPHSIRSLRLLSGMLFNVREAFLTSDALYQTTTSFGTPADNPAVNPDTTFEADIQAAANFRDTLNYPREVFDALELCQTARDRIDELIKHGAAEARINDPVVRGAAGGYTEVVTRAEIWDTWEAVGIAFAHVDRFFLEAEGFSILDLFENTGAIIKRFLDGLYEGLNLHTEQGWEDAMTLAEKWLKNSPIAAAFQPVLLGGVLWGAGKKVVKTVQDVYGIVSDPEQFIQQITKAIEMVFNTPAGDLMYALGKGLGETGYKEIQRLNGIDNPFHFVFEIGVLLGPIVLEIVLSWFLQAYIVVPALNYARRALTDIFFPALRAMDPVDNLVRATRLLPDGTARPNRTMPDVIDADDVPDVPYDYGDPLPAAMPDGTPLPVKTMTRSVVDDAVEELLGLNAELLAPNQLVLWKPNDVIPTGQRMGMRTAFIDEPDAPNVRVLTQDQINAEVWDADTQRMVRTKMVTNRFVLDDRMGHVRARIEEPNANLPVLSHNPLQPYSSADVINMQRTLYYLTHDSRIMNYARYDNIMRHLGPDSDLDIDDQMRLLNGMAKAQNGLNDAAAFRALLNRYATGEQNWRLFLIIGQDDVDIPNSLWASATFPDGRLNDRIANMLAQTIRNRQRLDELIEPLHWHIKRRIRDAYDSDDFVRDRFETQQTTFSTMRTGPERLAIQELPANLRDEACDIFNAFGVMGWLHRQAGMERFFSRPNWRNPSLPQTVEMWVRRNYTTRTQADFDEQALISAGYNQMLNDSNLTMRVHAGHLIAHRHGGPTTGANMIPMSADFNVAAYGRIERMTDWCLRYHDDVYVQVEVGGYTNGLATSLRYKAFVRDANGNPRLLVNEVLEADVLDNGSRFDLE